VGLLNNLIVKIRGDSTHLETTLNKTGSTIKAWAGKIAGFLGVAFGVQAIVNFSKEAMRAAAEIEGIKNAYTKFGDEGKRVLEDIRKATRGVIQEDELMRLAVKAQSLNIPFKDLGTYLTFATNQAIRLGKPVQEFADLMISEVGRQAARGLVAMGLAQKEATEAFKGAGGIIAFVTKKLEEMGPVLDTTAIKMGQLKVSGVELKEAWGAWLNKSPVIASFRSYFTDLLKAWADESMTFTQKAAMLLPWYGGQMTEKAIWQRGQKQTAKERAAEGVSPAGTTGIQKLLDNAQKPAEKLTKTIADLELELTQAQIDLKDFYETDTAGIQKQLRLIDELKKKIEALTTLPTIGPKRAEPIPLAEISQLEIPGLTTSPVLAPINTEALDEYNENLEASIQNTQDILKDGLTMAANLAGDMMESLGEALSGGDFSDLGKNVLKAFASFLSQLGTLLMAEGTALVLAGLGISPKGWAMIAGGAALKLAAGLVSGSVNNSPASHSSRGGGESSGYGAAASVGYANTNLNNIKIIVEGKISGRDIVLSGKRYSTELSRST